MVKKMAISIKNKILSLVKKRAFYAAFVGIFSVLLLADTGIGLLAPVQIQLADDMGGWMSMDLSERGNASNASDEADILAAGQMPEMSGATQSRGVSAMRFLYTVKSHWLAILIILALLDIAGIVMLVRLTKKERARHLLELKEEMEADGEVHLIRKPKKRGRHAYMTWIVPAVGLLLVVAVVKVLTAQSAQKISRTEASVYSAEAEKGSIRTVLPGTGTLTEDAAATLDLPEGVEIAEWYVSNGDFVEVGDKLAKADKTSVMTVIASIQEMLDSLDEAMAEHEDDEISETVEITASGRVKAIYAQEDVSVVDTMYEHGALMLISLDGTMAVSIETEESLFAGDTVVVTLSDGTEEIGKVESIIDGTAVITLTDDGPKCGDEVSVATEDKAVLGSGELYIHSELKVTGFIGTVTNVAVSVEDEVDAGDELLTLDNTGYIGEYELLAAQRAELETKMQALFKLYEEEYIYAEYAGKISGLSETVTAAATIAFSAGNTAAAAQAVTGIQLLTYSNTAARAPSNTGLPASLESCAVAPLSAAAYTEDPTTDGAEEDVGEEDPADDPENTEVPENDPTEPEEPENTEKPEENPPETNEVCYIAVVSAVSYQKIDVLLYPEVYDMGESIDQNEIVSLTDQMTVEAALELSMTDLLYLYKDGELTDGRIEDIQEGCLLVLAFDVEPELDADDLVVEPVSVIYMEPSEENTPDNGQNPPDSENGKDGENSETSERNMPSSSGSGGSLGTVSGATRNNASDSGMLASTVTGTSSEKLAAAANEIAEQYSVKEVTWLSVTPQDSMKITISVDEMDILALEVGQEAIVTLDAFPGRSFEGVVTSIDRNGANSGGSSKYAAVITIDRSDDMLAGMNASVKITLETTEDVLIIPVTALVEDETGVYVYTEYDEKSNALGGLTEVTTGVSDGESVEILSGLTEGSKYWYSCLDVVNYSSSYVSSEDSGGFSLPSLFGGGDRR